MRKTEHREECQLKISDLDYEIQKLKAFIETSVTDGSREFYRAKIERLYKRQKAFLALLREEVSQPAPGLETDQSPEEG